MARYPTSRAERIELDIARLKNAEFLAKNKVVAWQVRRVDGDGGPLSNWEACTQEFYDFTLATGRYGGFEKGPQCEVRALTVAETKS